MTPIYIRYESSEIEVVVRTVHVGYFFEFVTNFASKYPSLVPKPGIFALQGNRF